MTARKSYGPDVDRIHEHEAEVLRELYPEELTDIKDDEFNPGDLTILRGRGKPTARTFKVEDTVRGANYTFVARFYSDKSEGYMGNLPLPVLSSLSYSFLRDSGINVPKAVYLKRAPNWLFTEYIPGLSIWELLAKSENGKAEEILADITDKINLMSGKVNKHVKDLSREDYKTLFAHRSVEEQTRDYLTKWLGEHREARHVSEDLVFPLFLDSLNGKYVSHGDLSPDNMIRHSDTGIDYVIDPRLRIRSRLTDLGGFLAYLANYYSTWERTMGRCVADENPADVRFEGFATSWFGSLRICAKRIEQQKRSGRSRDYSGQRRTMSFVLNSLVANPTHFGLSDEKVKLAETLRDNYFQYEKIEPVNERSKTVSPSQ